jgi:hypothetical protein
VSIGNYYILKKNRTFPKKNTRYSFSGNFPAAPCETENGGKCRKIAENQGSFPSPHAPPFFTFSAEEGKKSAPSPVVREIFLKLPHLVAE